MVSNTFPNSPGHAPNNMIDLLSHSKLAVSDYLTMRFNSGERAGQGRISTSVENFIIS
jgi:hypothetical protein